MRGNIISEVHDLGGQIISALPPESDQQVEDQVKIFKELARRCYIDLETETGVGLMAMAIATLHPWFCSSAEANVAHMYDDPADQAKAKELVHALWQMTAATAMLAARSIAIKAQMPKL